MSDELQPGTSHIADRESPIGDGMDTIVKQVISLRKRLRTVLSPEESGPAANEVKGEFTVLSQISEIRSVLEDIEGRLVV